jgi:hypothetical protein
MASIDDIISSSPMLSSIANAFGVQRDKYVDPELPYTRPLYGIRTNDTLTSLNTNPLYYLPKSTVPTDLPESIRSYRADPTNRYGGNTGLETLPYPRFFRDEPELPEDKWVAQMQNLAKVNNLPLDYFTKTGRPIRDTHGVSELAVKELYRYARNAGAAGKHGLPTLTPEELAAFALKEGRSDYGFNSLRGSPKEKKREKELQEIYDIHPNDLNFLMGVASKKDVASRLNIPLAEAWNGTGVNSVNQTGKDYAKDWNYQYEATKHPKNKELMQLIQRAYAEGQKYGFPLMADRVKNTSVRRMKEPYKKGGAVQLPENYRRDGNSKLI